MRKLTTLLVLLISITLIGCKIKEELKTPDNYVNQSIESILTDEDKKSTIILIEDAWTDWRLEQTPEKKHNFDTIEEGTIIYETNFGIIKVKRITSDKLVLSIEDGDFVESDTKGGIDLTAKPIRSFTLRHGEMIELHSQTMDAGVVLTVIFN